MLKPFLDKIGLHYVVPLTDSISCAKPEIANGSFVAGRFHAVAKLMYDQ